MCPHSELFWSAFSRIQTEYGEIRSIPPYSPRIRENAAQNNSKYGAFLRTENKKQVTTNIYTVLYCPGLLFLISRGIIGRKV